jgi:hypothetical protein
VLFPGFRFEHPITGRQIFVGGPSYIWAGLLGPIYVLWFRRGGILRSLGISMMYGFAMIGVIGASTYVPSVYAVLMLAVLVPGVILSHGRATIFAVRINLSRRGWLVCRD